MHQLDQTWFISFVQINIGIMSFQHDTMKPVRGRTLPLSVGLDTDAAELHLLGVKKMTDFYSDLDEGPYVLIYPDRTEVNIIPGTLKPFTVREYKAQIGKPYNRITLFICRKVDYDRSKHSGVSWKAELVCFRLVTHHSVTHQLLLCRR